MLTYAKTIQPKVRINTRVLHCKDNTCRINTRENICVSCITNVFDKEKDIVLFFTNGSL